MLNRVECSSIHVGSRFSDSVYFDDGMNMFLGKNKKARGFHISALRRWNVPYLLSEGEAIPDDAEIPEDLEELEPAGDDIEELEAV